MYETWCLSCELSEMTGMVGMGEELTPQHPGIVREKHVAKYIGETARGGRGESNVRESWG